jgi:hypothetical protein
MSYTLTIQNFKTETVEVLQFTNIANALQELYARCETYGFNVTPDNDGNFVAGGVSEEWRIELNSNF